MSENEPAWLRQAGLACEFCGGPGHLVPIPEPVSVVFSDEMPTYTPMQTVIACPEHRFLVRERALNKRDPRRFAERDHGRPVLDEETYPDRVRRSIRTLLDRLAEQDG